MIAPPEREGPDGRFERQFADATTVVILLVIATEVIAWFSVRQPWLLRGAVVLAVLLSIVRHGRRLAIRGRAASAARWLGAGLMLATFAYAFVVPRLAPVLTVVPLMVVALLLPHMANATVRRRNILVGAWFTSVLVMLVSILLDRVPGDGGFDFIDGFVLFSLSNTHALTLLLVGQYDQRVHEHLDRLAESESRLRAVVETAADAVLVMDADERVTRANRMALELFARSHGELIGASISNLVTLDGAIFSPSGSLGGYASVGRRGDGGSFPAEVSIGSRFGDGEKVLIVRDVSDRTRAAAELARRADALVRSNRELERFAYVASHDLQEPLRKIQAFGALIDESARDRLDPEEQQALDYLIDAATRQRALINDLLAYSRARTRPRQVGIVDLDAVLGEVLDDLSPTIAETAAIIETDPMPVVRADHSQMRQLLQNLLANALKYRDRDRRPRITVQSTALTRDPPHGLLLAITDNGIGFEDRFAERIFEPFRRLHPRHEYPGSGVGLAICQQIAERHGGTITARGDPGNGSTFTVELPLEHIQGGADEREGEAAAESQDSAG